MEHYVKSRATTVREGIMKGAGDTVRNDPSQHLPEGVLSDHGCNPQAILITK